MPRTLLGTVILEEKRIHRKEVTVFPLWGLR